MKAPLEVGPVHGAASKVRMKAGIQLFKCSHKDENGNNSDLTPRRNVNCEVHIRPRLEQEFQRIFKWKPGIYPYDTTGVNLELALASPKWSTADKSVVAEIKSAVSEIKKRLEPK